MRMGRRALPLAGALGLVALAACGSFGAANEDAPAPTAVDGGTPTLDGAATDSGGANAEGGDASDASGLDCRVVIQDEFDSLDPVKWEVFTKQTPPVTPPPSIQNGSLRLIDDQPTRGALVRWKEPIAAAKIMRVEMTFRIGPLPGGTGSVGDALAVAWLDSSVPISVEGQGTDANLCDGDNVGGLVYIGTTNGDIHVGDIQAGACGSGGIDLPEFDTNAHDITFDVAGTQVHGSYDGSSKMFDGVSPAPMPASFNFVISASSGGAYAAHYIERVRVTLCN